MKVTIYNRTSSIVSTDYGVLGPGTKISISNVTPDEAFKASESLKVLQDKEMIFVTVDSDQDRLDTLEPIMPDMLSTAGVYSEEYGIQKPSGAMGVGVMDRGQFYGSSVLEEILYQIGSSLQSANRVASNVQPISNPDAATATEVANKINQLIQVLINAGLMVPQN